MQDRSAWKWLLGVPLIAAGPAPVQHGASEAPNPAFVRSPPVPRPSAPGDIVGLVVQNTQSAAVPAQEMTFGQVFQPGQVQAGAHLAARVGGRVIPVQMDVKATNPDHSVRMAVLTLQHPALAPGASADIMLVPGGEEAAPAVDMTKLTAPGYSLVVDLAVHTAGGTTPYHLDAGALLAAALASGAASPWLHGPQVSETRVDAPVTGSLHVAFDIRSYAGGASLTNVEFDNDIAMQASGGTIDYDATITLNGKVVLHRPGLTQFQYQTWNQEVWSGATPAIHILHDVAALERTGAVLGWNLVTGIDPTLINDLKHRITAEGYTPLGNAGITKYMGQTGGRPELGPSTLWSIIWLMTQRPEAASYTLEQARVAGSVPWHLWDPATRSYITTAQYPKLWAGDYRAGTGGTVALRQAIPLDKAGNAVSGWAPDTAHVPSLSYIPYLLTGTRYWLDQLNAQASFGILETWPGARNDGDAIVATKEGQVRAGAWALRDIVQAAYIDPDGNAMKGYFTAVLDRNLDYLLQQTRTAQEGEAYGYLNASGKTTATWQQNYLSSSLILAAGQGNEKAKRILEWQTNFIAGRFLAADRGFSPYGGAAYYLSVADASGKPLQSWAEIARATAADGQANDGKSWPSSVPEDYIQSAYGVLAGHITITGSPESVKAFEWLTVHAPAAVGPAAMALSPDWNIAPHPPASR